MIVTETKTIGTRDFRHTYSDTGYRIRQVETGIVYDDAVDPLSSSYTYEETDELIEVPEKPGQEV